MPDAESYLSYLEATPGCSTAAERLCTDLAYGRAMGLRLVSAEAVSDVVAGSGLRKSSAGDSQARVAPEPWIVEQLELLASGDTEVPGGVVGLDYVRITLYLAKSGMRGVDIHRAGFEREARAYPHIASGSCPAGVDAFRWVASRDKARRANVLHNIPAGGFTY